MLSGKENVYFLNYKRISIFFHLVVEDIVLVAGASPEGPNTTCVRRVIEAIKSFLFL